MTAEELLDQRHPHLRELALWVHARVLEAEPEFVVKVYDGWDGIGYHHPDGGYVCGLFPRGHEVRLLFEHGARLPDPDGLFSRGGRQTRIIAIIEAGEALAEAIPRYVQEAIVERLLR